MLVPAPSKQTFRTVRENERMVTVTLSGDLDIYAIPDVERKFAAISDEQIVIDLSYVQLVSAAFIGALSRLRKRLPDSHIEIVGANRNVRRIFRIVRATSIVVIV
jgi:anti-anti-sigma factor